MILFFQQIDNSHLLLTSVVAIIAALLVAGFLETVALARLGWAPRARAVGFAAATNMITPVLAFVFLVLAFLVFAFSGVQSYTNFQEHGALKISIYLLFPLLIVILRRQMLKILEIDTGRNIFAWLYSVAATKITFWLTAIFIYFFYIIFKL